MGRWVKALGAGFIVCLTVGFTSGPAAAFDRDPVKVSFGTDTKVDYPPLVGNFPAGGLQSGGKPSDPNPQLCQTPATYCDDIPFDVVRPNVKPADDWFLTITISWEPKEKDSNSDTQVNDIDVFSWDDGQIKRRDHTPVGPGDLPYTSTGNSASANNPEIIKIFKPSLGRYHLDPANFSGANQAYHVTWHIDVSPFNRPFESLNPAFNGSRKSTTISGGASPDLPVDNSFIGAPPAVAVGAGPALSDVAIRPDTQLNVTPPSGFDWAIAPPSDLPSVANAAVRPAGPASPALLVLAFVVIPGGMLGGMWFLAARRRRILL